jgi:ABC-2 type transport system ATP-binding protein
VHVDDMANRACGKLSKGYKQRVGLAQALIHDPEVLVLDEPTAGLDPKQIIETRDLIKSLGGTHTIVLSTHILPEVAQTCQKVVIINKGRIVAIDSPDNLTQRLKGAATIYVQIEAHAHGDPAGALASLPNVKVVPVDHHKAAQVLKDSNHDIAAMARIIGEHSLGLLERGRIGWLRRSPQLTTEEQPQAAAGNEANHG